MARRCGSFSDSGQATVELALGLPIVALLLLAGAQIVVVARDQLAVVHAAREAARAAAVTSGPARGAADAARRATALAPLDVVTNVAGGEVRVVVQYVSRTRTPIVGRLVPDVVVRGAATMQVEP